VTDRLLCCTCGQVREKAPASTPAGRAVHDESASEVTCVPPTEAVIVLPCRVSR